MLNFFILDIVCSTTTLAFDSSLLNLFCFGVRSAAFSPRCPRPVLLLLKAVTHFIFGKYFLIPSYPLSKSCSTWSWRDGCLSLYISTSFLTPVTKLALFTLNHTECTFLLV